MNLNWLMRRNRFKPKNKPKAEKREWRWPEIGRAHV